MLRSHIFSPSGPTASAAVLMVQRRAMMGLFEEDRSTNASDRTVAAFVRRADHLERAKTIIDRTAYGIPFHVSEEETVDAVCRHHGASVRVHGVERFLMPFWLATTAAGGTFRADLLQRDPAFMTQQQCVVWVEGPNYEFQYPFGDHHVCNQVSASYIHPLSLVERCVAGTHVPSMLISRFELLKELEAMEKPPKIVPFTMSTSTALSVVDARLTREIVLDRIDRELRKFHGSFIRSNVTLLGFYKESLRIRPVFLPMVRLTITTATSSTPCPSFVCGATGKVVGPVLHLSRRAQTTGMVAAGAVALLLAAPFVEPGTATALATASAVAVVPLRRYLLAMRFLRNQARAFAELKAAGMLYFSSDQEGYRWSPDDEERAEYEYREELRKRARHKEDFEQRVKEEAARDEARRGRHVDAKRRRRTDLVDTDPLGYYQLLGLTGKEFSATAKDIAKGFREAAQRHHPDVTTESDGLARNKMQKIIQAYKILRNPETKKAYDSGRMKSAKADTV